MKNCKIENLKLNPALQREMEMRRIGNICWVARENGWRMEVLLDEGRGRVRCRFVSPEGKRLLGEWCRDPQVALRRACEEVEKLL